MNVYGDETLLRHETMVQAIERRLVEVRERCGRLNQDQRILTTEVAQQDWLAAIRGVEEVLTPAQARALNASDPVTARELRLRGMMPMGL